MPSNPTNFLHWRCQSFARRKMPFASNEDVEDLDCEERFDCVVPTSILKRFFDLAPPKVAGNHFCDLRLCQIFAHMTPVERRNVGDPNMWLLAHCRIPMEEKLQTFDDHGQHDTSDQLSFGSTQPLFVQKFPKLSPPQIAMCRLHLESIVLSCIGWNDCTLDMAQRAKID